MYSDFNKKSRRISSEYDTATALINSEKYVFAPENETFAIDTLRKEYFSQIIALADTELGKDYLSESVLSDFFKTSISDCCKVGLINGNVAGFVLCKIIIKDQLSGCLRIDEDKLPEYISSVENVCLIKTISVSGRYQRQGIGFKLVESINEDVVVKKKIDAVCSVAWKNGNNINVDGVFSSIGLQKYIEVDDYWKEDSINKKYSCPQCGEPPCNCSAIIYFCLK